MKYHIETCNHKNRFGVIIEFRCKDDFAFKTDVFKEFAHDVALHLIANGDSKTRLLDQPFLKNLDITVKEERSRVSKALGVQIGIFRHVYYGPSH